MKKKNVPFVTDPCQIKKLNESMQKVKDLFDDDRVMVMVCCKLFVMKHLENEIPLEDFLEYLEEVYLMTEKEIQHHHKKCLTCYLEEFLADSIKALKAIMEEDEDEEDNDGE